jgi:uncharacterized heparinase superfamily protein
MGATGATAGGQGMAGPGRREAWLTRLHAWIAGLPRPASGFVSQPEPRSIGMVARGRQLVAGNYLMGGFLVEAPGVSLWDVPPPDRAFSEAAHGFQWLDDLAAAGDAPARALAQAWTSEWIGRYGRGRGPGWTPELTGRRLIRWINHALLLLHAQDRAAQDAWWRAISRQTVYLSRRWPAARPGLPRFEALCGLIYAGLSLSGMERRIDRAVAALARECRREIDAAGGIPSRNPEELLEIFTLLIWVAQALAAAGRIVAPEHRGAIERIAPTLRALRHADGGLARFHGGGRGLEGRIEMALAASGLRPQPCAGMAMGYARLAAGRTTVIVDAAAPPGGAASEHAHASTLAFELTSGRRPVIVSCGHGAVFGPEWARAGRATASHSTLAVEGFSSSRLGAGDRLAERAQVRLGQGPGGRALTLAHDGWSATHGLSHVRVLELDADGRLLRGEDTLGAITGAERRRFDAVMSALRLQGVRFAIRFHLHPEVEAALDLGGTAVSLVLRSGEIWVFRHDGVADLALEPSVYLERGRLRPRATQQIVLAGVVTDYAFTAGWTLAKAQDTPLAIRDLDPGDPAGGGAQP